MNIKTLYATNPKLNKSDVKDLEKWMKTQPHLPKSDEKVIIILLNACELDVERAKKCIEYYYTCRSSFPAVFAERDPELPRNIQAQNVSMFEPLEKLSPKGHVIFYSKLIDSSIEKYDFCDIVKMVDMRIHVFLQNVGCVNGAEVIADMEGTTWRHWQKNKFTPLRKTLGYSREGFPVRLRAVHFINPMYFVNAMLAVMHPFMSSELKQAVKIHNKIETLFEVLPKYCIPNHLGGTGGDIDDLHRSNIETIRMNRDYYIEDENMKSDESKRIKTEFFQRFGF